MLSSHIKNGVQLVASSVCWRVKIALCIAVIKKLIRVAKCDVLSSMCIGCIVY